MSIPSAGRWFGSRRDRASKPRRGKQPFVEAVEARTLLSSVLPDIVVDSATTTDSRSVTVDYDILNADLTQPLTFGVYRSDQGQLDAGSVSLGSSTTSPAVLGPSSLDAAGQPATAQGHHELTLPLPGGLPPNPSHPYVVVAADPSNTIAEVSKANNSASFRTYLIGIVTHGGLQPKSWSKTGSPWAVKMARSLLADGYDAVIPYNWVLQSVHPGEAVKQGPIVARKVLQIANAFPPNDPVDLHFIGQSEGAVVNDVAIAILKNHGTPQTRAGFIVDTMLDPHAANNSALGGQISSKHGVTGTLAKVLVEAYQWQAKDPVPSVPSNVGIAQVYFQHTPIKLATGSNGGVYNLWGQHVRGQNVVYANLSGPGISHGGDFRVQDWYQENVVPLLVNGPVFVNPGVLAGIVNDSVTLGHRGLVHAVSTSQPTMSGTAFPGASVRLFAVSPVTPGGGFIGQTIAGPDGSWSIVSHPLGDGHYRLLARARVQASAANPRVQITPRATLGSLWIDTKGRLP
jgi:hypothetical protein